MSVHQRRLKSVTFTANAVDFECQLTSWNLDPGIKDGDRVYTFCTDATNNVFIEETDDEPSLDLKFVADWRLAGISDFLWANNGQTLPFVLDHHPDIVGEHVRFAGQVFIKAAPVGGDARVTEMTEVTLQIVGSLSGNSLFYTRIG